MEKEKKARILVVEDDPTLARFLELELDHEGYTVETVGNGHTAVVRALEEDWDLRASGPGAGAAAAAGDYPR
ncbi:hypothetical protein [Thermodesulfitimonas sp.]